MNYDLPDPSYHPVPGLKRCDVPGFELYWCTATAPTQVWSWWWSNQLQSRCKWRCPKVRRGIKGKDHGESKYDIIRLYGPDQPRQGFTTNVHRLVLLTWGGAPPTPAHQVRHLDSDLENSAFLNSRGTPRLAWATALENQADEVAMGKTMRGEKNPAHKLTLGDVLELMRLRVELGWGYRKLGAHFGVCESLARGIIKGTAWSWVERPAGLRAMWHSK